MRDWHRLPADDVEPQARRVGGIGVARLGIGHPPHARGDLGFDGVVISDDMGRAEQLQAWPLRKRALKFVHAGGNMILTVDPTQAQTITQSIIDYSQSHPAMRRQVNRSALKVLQAKHRAGLDP